ncbi:hypothetical protein D3C77_517210 [compost metagenome]
MVMSLFNSRLMVPATLCSTATRLRLLAAVMAVEWGTEAPLQAAALMMGPEMPRSKPNPLFFPASPVWLALFQPACAAG